MDAGNDFSIDGVDDPSCRWAALDPFAFLDLLRSSSGRMVRALQAPTDWVTLAHAPRLIALCDATDAVPAVCFIASPHVPAVSYRSTVGHEAGRMLEALRHGWRYPGTCSDLSHVDTLEIAIWWAARSSR